MKTTNKSQVGTYFHKHTLRATYNELLAIMGSPEYSNNSGEDKTNFEWIMETAAGELFTVYDWKENRPIAENELIEWHIGAHTTEASEHGCQEVNEALVKIRRQVDDNSISRSAFLSEVNLEHIANRIKFTATPEATKEWIKHEIRLAFLAGYDQALTMSMQTLEKITQKTEYEWRKEQKKGTMHPIFQEILKPYTD